MSVVDLRADDGGKFGGRAAVASRDGVRTNDPVIGVSTGRAAVAGGELVENLAGSLVVSAVVVGAAVDVDDVIVFVVHDERRHLRVFYAIGYRRIVVCACRTGDAVDKIRCVAGQAQRRAAAVGQACGVDAVSVHVVLRC